MRVEIPGCGLLEIAHLVLDYNGTIALDGELLDGVGKRLEILSRKLDIHVLTADTFGSVAAKTAGLPFSLAVLPPGNQDQAKLDCVNRLGPAGTACIGNGRNDALMLRESALGIAVIGQEGAAGAALTAADVIVTHVQDGLDLLLNPLRLAATLRV
ncbi:MAG: HAD family hydrolase [Desulfovibrionales bacterium]